MLKDELPTDMASGIQLILFAMVRKYLGWSVPFGWSEPARMYRVSSLVMFLGC